MSSEQMMGQPSDPIPSSDPDIASALVNGGVKDAESAPLPGRM